MSNDRLQGGMKHAPGVMCIVQIPIANRSPAPSNHNQTVTIVKSLGTGGRMECYCGCGRTGSYRVGSMQMWEVTGRGLWMHNKRVTHRGFPQRYLIPIGDSSLIEGEKWEATNPKEDKLDRAISTSLKHTKQAEDQLI